MMVSWVRGHFKDVRGSLEFDLDNPTQLSIQATMESNKLWTGEPQRDKHLRSPDFVDAENHPTIAFQSTECTCVGTNDYRVSGDLTIRGVSRPVILDLHYLGRWRTPYWTDAGDAGPIARIGFAGEARINRHDFGVSWNGALGSNGTVVGDEVFIHVDIEALLQSELQKAQSKR
jgi:polyisoprenoid-binding protein YceI